MRENNQLLCFGLNAGCGPRKKSWSYRDDNVRVNHSDRRLIFADISASFSKKEVELASKFVTSCCRASKLR